MIFIGELRPGSTSAHRLNAFRDLGIESHGIDIHPEPIRRRENRLSRRIVRRILGPRDLAGTNRTLLERARETQPQLVWIDRGTTIKRETLEELRAICPDARLVHYNPDDPFGAYGLREWPTFLEAIPAYDVHLVPRKPNVAEYRERGARRVEQVVPFWGYDPETHRPLEIPEEERRRLGAPVGFIGMAERERASSIARLAREELQVKVWGNRWERYRDRDGARYTIAGPAQFGERYSRIIASFDINLAFLRHQNRDEHTSRSVELPAAGAFMLAERTDEHLELFEQGKEAEFFAGDDELVDKVRYYLDRPQLRQRLALAGHERAKRSGYDNASVLRRMLAVVTSD
jgi:glycosyltransferase involved in cell wall biosynthesis